jgi:hypothetical protein
LTSRIVAQASYSVNRSTMSTGTDGTVVSLDGSVGVGFPSFETGGCSNLEDVYFGAEGDWKIGREGSFAAERQ